MRLSGILIGLMSFAIIGLFHPVVIKCEYYFGARVWPAFLAAGIGFLLLSLLPDSVIVSSTLGVLGFTCLWSIGELREQRRRVERGWFPENPNRKKRG
ncbi:DUF4491 family protein [Harryflintia acetispora]|uniref:DUF4491 family protein n=1 Tax=Harryflintia acetispora TaxID=1849041 RepID=UPI001897A0A8|nr:DUF4491 family protein [Harryflintia acetispora]